MRVESTGQRGYGRYIDDKEYQSNDGLEKEISFVSAVLSRYLDYYTKGKKI